MPFPVPGRIAESLRRSTVQIRGSQAQIEGCGSGIVLNERRILTNAHVVSGENLTVETWDGRSQRAKITKVDRARDLAVLVTEGLDAPPAILAAVEPKPGQPVIAVGNPLGFVGAVSTGFVYRLGGLRGLGSRRWIQADVRLAPGNSGGPLADINGHVLGVNTMVVAGLALSIPAAAAQVFLSNPASQGVLGAVLRLIMLRAPRHPVRPALMILELTQGGAADRASLLPGDILLNANGHSLHSPDDLSLALSAGTVHLEFHRAGNSRVRRVTVQLTAAPFVSAA